uniref:Uncharacterized protein n=1 Tax=viral metagenome TaxID=1070528 RepID=A0A6M3KVT7_9ZZZZ
MPLYVPEDDVLLNAIDEKLARLAADKAKRRQPVVFNNAPEWAIPQQVVPQQPLLNRTAIPFNNAPSYEIPVSFGALEQAPGLTMPQAGQMAEQVTPAEPPKREYAWWEKPAEGLDWAMKEAGQGIAKLPVVPEVLRSTPVQWALGGLQWLDELVAASTLQPLFLSPGEMVTNTVQEKLEKYRKWNAPTYLKGVVEILNPIDLGLFVGWAVKGAKALAKGAKLVSKSLKAADEIAPWVAEAALAELGEEAAYKIIPKAGSLLKLTPTSELVKDLGDGWFRRLVRKEAEKHPVYKTLIEAVGGRSMFATDAPQNALDHTYNSLFGYAVHLEDAGKRMGLGKIALFNQLGGRNVQDIFKIKDGIVGVVKETADSPSLAGKVSRYVTDVFRRPEAYEWVDPAARKTLDDIFEWRDWMQQFARDNGVKIPILKDEMGNLLEYFPKIATGKVLESGEQIALRSANPFLHEIYTTMQEGMANGIRYSDDIIGMMDVVQNTITSKVARKYLVEDLKELGTKYADRWMLYNPKLSDEFADWTAKKGILQKTGTAVKNFTPGAGQIIGKPIRKDLLDDLREIGLGDLADKITVVQRVRGINVGKYLKLNAESLSTRLGINKAEFNVFLEEVSKGDLDYDDIVKLLNGYSKKQSEIVDISQRAWREAANEEFDVLHKRAKTLAAEVKDAISEQYDNAKPLRAQVSELKKMYGRVKSEEGQIGRLAELRQYAFPKDVTETVNKVIGERGNEWLRAASKVSGVSRTLTATLDLSTLFITGLPVFGRNPLAWAKGAWGVLQAIKDPNYINKYLTSNRDLLMLYISKGGSADVVDMFESAGDIGRVLQETGEKIGKEAGGKLGRDIGAQVLGRAESVYQTMGAVSRLELFKAGLADITSKGMADELAELQTRQLVRSIELMTGNISTKAIGIPLLNRQFESAFLLFAPRYTRASLALVGDTMRGGIAGSEARKAIGGMLVGGLTMYHAVCTALEQQEQLDPSSSKFMTIEVGNRRVGVGGIYTSLLRMLAETVTDVAQGDISKLSPLNTSRTDNPFYRFFYSRTAPLTSFVSGLAFEHTNYLGEPLESVEDYVQFLSDKITPMALQSVMSWEEKSWQGPMNRPAVFTANFMGLREFPKSPFEMRDEARDNVALNKYGKEYEELTRAERNEVNSNPTIKTLDVEAGKIEERTGDKESITFNRFSEQVAEARERRDDLINRAAQVAEQNGDYQWFNQTIGEIEGAYVAQYKGLSSSTEYSEVLKKLDERRAKGGLKPEEELDIAYNVWANVMYGEKPDPRFGEMYSEFGEPNYNNQEKFRKWFIANYGERAMDYIENERPVSGRELHPLYLELRQARRMLKPYWAVATNYENTIGKPTTRYQQARMNKVVGNVRQKMLRTNRALNTVYTKFYREKPLP